jgi:hypothetical protein
MVAGYHPDVFRHNFENLVSVQMLTDMQEEVPINPIPTGENPDAVNLEPDLSDLKPEPVTEEFDDEDDDVLEDGPDDEDDEDDEDVDDEDEEDDDDERV